MKSFKIGRNIKILIWYMMGEMVKNRARFYLSCNYFCTLYLLGKNKAVKLQDFHNVACLNLNYGTTEQKWYNLSKLVTNTLQI